MRRIIELPAHYEGELPFIFGHLVVLYDAAEYHQRGTDGYTPPAPLAWLFASRGGRLASSGGYSSSGAARAARVVRYRAQRRPSHVVVRR